MALRKYRPLTPAMRHRITVTMDDITTDTPEKSLLAPAKRTGGRNTTGKMTMRYIGGGHKKMYRLIDFKRDKQDIPGIVQTIEYDPNRTARIALVHYKDGEKRYIIAPVGLKVGDVVQSGVGSEVRLGNAL